PYRAYSDHFHNYLEKLAASLSSPSPTPGSFATSTDATDSTIFIQYKTVSFEEDLHHEFKDISQNNQPVNSIGQIAEEYAVAFLNAEGGSIFWGIRDDGSVVGVELTRSQRDKISQGVSNKLSHISPSGQSLTCKIIFHEVYESDQKTIINDLCVVELAVPKASEVCYTKNGECFVKSYGIKRRLTPREVAEFVQHRSGKV
ncbi:MAG: ATP-binding protein, partial [Candidatus Poribacteria bacterium]|nr:ATP-binding protein [Candidatus Poribacteria bacterium]